jgi:hypothetical protein
MVRGGRLRPDVASALHLAWAAWADLSPKSLRAALRLYLDRRNSAAACELAGRPFVEWTPTST